MRVESSVTSLSWIPSEAVTGLNKAMFESGSRTTTTRRPTRSTTSTELQRTPTVPVREPAAAGSTSTTERSSTPATDPTAAD